MGAVKVKLSFLYGHGESCFEFLVISNGFDERFRYYFVAQVEKVPIPLNESTVRRYCFPAKPFHIDTRADCILNGFEFFVDFLNFY